MKICRILLVFLAILGFNSCNSSRDAATYSLPEFRQVREAEFEIISELPGMGAVDDICVYGNYVVLACYRFSDETYIHILDKSSGRLLMNAFHRGRGPNEILWSHNGYMDSENGTIGFFDIQQDKLVYCSIDSLVQKGPSSVKSSPYDIPDDAMFILPRTDDDEIVFNSPRYVNVDSDLLAPRVILRNKSGEVLATDNTYPAIGDPAVRDICNREARVAISPDGSKMAVGLAYASVLELYSLSDDSIKSEVINYYIKPDFETNGGLYPAFSDNTYQGVTDMFPTDDLLYTSYDGEVNLKKNSALSVSERALLSRNIAIFNWKGKALEKIITDYSIMRLCVSEEKDGTYIYALLHDTARNPYLGKLKL